MSVRLPILSPKLTLGLLGIYFWLIFDQIVTSVAFHYNLAGCHRAAFTIANLVSEFKGEGNIYHALLRLLSDRAPQQVIRAAIKHSYAVPMLATTTLVVAFVRLKILYLHC